MGVMCCPPNMAAGVWPHVAGFIRGAVEHTGDFALDELRDSVLSGPSLLWIITSDGEIKGAVITDLIVNQRGEKICDLVACGGKDLDSWRHLMPDLEKFAKSEGCQKVRLSGRRGWGRVFADFREAHVTYEKVL
jgi:hypothetical protein